jgi:hypothetical protein
VDLEGFSVWVWGAAYSRVGGGQLGLGVDALRSRSPLDVRDGNTRGIAVIDS